MTEQNSATPPSIDLGIPSDPAPAPADPAPAPADPAPAPAPTPAPQWYAPEDADYIGNKGWDKLEGPDLNKAMLNAYRGAEKLLGNRDNLVQLPGEGQDAERAELYKKLGLPDEPTKYDADLSLYEEDVRTELLQAFHNANLLPDQAAKLSEWLVSQEKASIEGNKEQRAERDASEITALKQEWGPGYAENSELCQVGADAAAKATGLEQADFNAMRDALGPQKYMKFLADYGRRANGGTSRTKGDGQSTFGDNTKAGLEAKKAALMSDPAFSAKLRSPDPIVRKTASDQLFSITTEIASIG